MKLKVLSNGVCYQILEELDRYDIILYEGKVLAIDKESWGPNGTRGLDIDSIKSQIDRIELVKWRNPDKKRKYINDLKELHGLILYYNRELKINELFKTTDIDDIICLAC